MAVAQRLQPHVNSVQAVLVLTKLKLHFLTHSSPSPCQSENLFKLMAFAYLMMDILLCLKCHVGRSGATLANRPTIRHELQFHDIRAGSKLYWELCVLWSLGCSAMLLERARRLSSEHIASIFKVQD